MNIKYYTNMVDETVVARTVYQVVLQWWVYLVENSVRINYLHLERNCEHRQQCHCITNI